MPFSEGGSAHPSAPAGVSGAEVLPNTFTLPPPDDSQLGPKRDCISPACLTTEGRAGEERRQRAHTGLEGDRLKQPVGQTPG